MPSHPFCRPRLLAAAAALACAGTAPSAGVINSDLTIEAGQTFELGGGQKGGFTVSGRNTGRVAVVVYGLAEGARGPVARGPVAPGAAVDAAFRPGEQALLRNTSIIATARLKLKVVGDTAGLGMTCSANP